MYRPGRDSDAEFQSQFIGNPLFAPSWVVVGHLLDQLLDVSGQLGTATLARFPVPEQSERCPVPLEEYLRLDDDERFAPIEAIRATRLQKNNWMRVSKKTS